MSPGEVTQGGGGFPVCQFFLVSCYVVYPVVFVVLSPSVGPPSSNTRVDNDSLQYDVVVELWRFDVERERYYLLVMLDEFHHFISMI